MKKIEAKTGLQNVVKGKNLLSVYFTAGYPNLEDTSPIILELQRNGVDLIEVGYPFSDPIADGPTIQESSTVALKNGMNLKLLFRQLESIKNEIRIPIILMGYLNPVLQFGVNEFVDQCVKTGVTGLIIPDLPLEEFETEYKAIFEDHGLTFIFLVTPQTSKERIKRIDELSKGFIYAVSSSSVTGAKKDFSEDQFQYLKKLTDLKLASPFLVGFGVSNHQTFVKVCEYTSGAIVGSAFISALKEKRSIAETVSEFIKKLREG